MLSRSWFFSKSNQRETCGNQRPDHDQRGHEISAEPGEPRQSDRSEPVDYVLYCERPRSFLVASTHPIFVVGETGRCSQVSQPVLPKRRSQPDTGLLVRKGLRIPLGRKAAAGSRRQALEKEQQMAVAVRRFETRLPEPLKCYPPQIQLAGTSKGKHRKR